MALDVSVRDASVRRPRFWGTSARTPSKTAAESEREAGEASGCASGNGCPSLRSGDGEDQRRRMPGNTDYRWRTRKLGLAQPKYTVGCTLQGEQDDVCKLKAEEEAAKPKRAKLRT